MFKILVTKTNYDRYMSECLNAPRGRHPFCLADLVAYRVMIYISIDTSKSWRYPQCLHNKHKTFDTSLLWFQYSTSPHACLYYN